MPHFADSSQYLQMPSSHKGRDPLLQWNDLFPPLNLHNYPNHTPMNNQGQKFDSDKPNVSLVDPSALLGLAKVLTFGAKKYSANNWRKGLEFSRVHSALMRHLLAIQQGEVTDPESGLPHIDHIGCCWMFLSAFMKDSQYDSFDDVGKTNAG